MKVFRLYADVNNYQSFILDLADPDLETSLAQIYACTFDGTAKDDDWKLPDSYIDMPKLKTNGIYGACQSQGVLVFDDDRLDLLSKFIIPAGQIFDFIYKGKTFHLLNITECIEALDESKSRNISCMENKHYRKYVFHEHRLGPSCLFKIPQTAACEILCMPSYDEEDDFKYQVESLGIGGLIFEEIWDSEKP